MRRTSEEFGAWVRAVKGTDSLRAADTKTGVSYTTISNMELGKIPEMETVVKFASGYKQDVNAALALAGYEALYGSLQAGEVAIPRDLAEELNEYLRAQAESAGKDPSDYFLHHHGGEGSLAEQEMEGLAEGIAKAFEIIKRRSVKPPEK